MAHIPPPPNSAAPTSTEDFLRADTLTEREKALRNLFVAEYMKDFNALRAAMRCGFPKDFAQQYAQQFMDEPYVQRKISELMGTPAADPKQEEEVNKQRIKQQLLKEAYYHGPGSSHAARVAALAKLAALYGMEAPKKTELTHKHQGGVMRVPAVAANADAWETAAVESQQALHAGS